MRITFSPDPWAPANGVTPLNVFVAIINDDGTVVSGLDVECNVDGEAVFSTGLQTHYETTDATGQIHLEIFNEVAQEVILSVKTLDEEELSSSIKITFVPDTVWGQFKELHTLSIGFAASPSSRKAKIYANSLNQVELVVKFEAINLQGEPMEVSPELLMEAISLCNYTTGNPLSDNWVVDYKEGKFNRALEYDVAKNSSGDERAVITLSLFVSAIKAQADETIAVSIYIDGVGLFNTTAEGTPTLNGPGGQTGSKFVAPSSVIIGTVDQLDYSSAQNVEVINRVDGTSSYVTTVHDIEVERVGGVSENTGKFGYQVEPTYIKASKENHNLISKEVDRKNWKLSNLTMVVGCDQTFSIPFSGVQKADEWTYVYALWVEQKEIGTTSGGIQMMQSRIIDKAVIYHTDGRDLVATGELRDGFVSVRTTQYDITIDELYIDNWSHSPQSTTIKVQDNFGNIGVITVELVNTGGVTEGSYHPYLKVNGS